MSEKTILAIASPVTQSREAVQSLITYQNSGVAPAEMPPFYRIAADMVLVQSKKGDCYYVTTPKGCTCPAAAYHPGQHCKHQRKFYPQQKRQAAARQPEETGSIRPNVGSFKPVSLLPSEEKAAGVA